MKIITTYTYVSDDGKTFDDELSCLEHERRIKEGGIYMQGSQISIDELYSHILNGYWLANYEPGRLKIFYPEPHGGSCGEIFGEDADKLGAIFDKHNYRVHQLRKEIKLKQLTLL